MTVKKKKGVRKEFGKYRLIAHLATGGMAEIYLASQTSLAGFEKLLVIKRILPNLANKESFVKMFLDEARIAATFNHTNVVHIFDLGRIDGQFFIAMEYLPGEALSLTIKAARKRGSLLPPELAAGIILQAAEGLHHAHMAKGPDGQSLNIIHRDISPQNLFVLYDGGVKVVDFGIAKADARNTKTRTGVLKGKYAYMSPEQIQSKPLDPRSDVFALGIALWESLTCRKLYNQDNDLDLLKAIIEQDAPSPDTRNPLVPQQLCEITLKALARDREQRYQSAAELRQALAQYIKTAQVEADTVAIGSFMHYLFADRIKTKQNLINEVQNVDKEMDEDYLFGDISQYLSDTEHSVPNSTPTGAQTASPKPATSSSRPKWPWIVFPVVIAAAVGMSASFLWRGEQTPVATDAGTEISKGSLEPVSKPPNTGSDPLPAGARDGGASEPKSDSKQGRAEAGISSAGKKPTKKPISLRKKKKKRKRKKKTVAIKPKSKAPTPIKKEPVGPPGTLRLMTSPWTEIYYKGKKLGQTPLIDVKLPAGKIKLKAVNEDAGINRTITLTIKSGERTTKRFNFF